MEVVPSVIVVRDGSARERDIVVLHMDPAGTTDRPVERIESWDALETYRSRVRGHDRGYLDSLGDDELLTPREMNVDGKIMRYSPADIFVHAMLHERQHHGDLNTLLYQHGVDVPIVEYRFSLPESGPA